MRTNTHQVCARRESTVLDTSKRFTHTAHMAGTDRKRLASYVRQRRVALGYRVRRDFAREVGLTDRTLGTLESGQHVGLDTLAAIEIGLVWAPGSAERVLDGGEPTVPTPGSPRAAEYEQRLHLERAALIEEIRRAALRLAAIDGELAPEPRNERRTV